MTLDIETRVRRANPLITAEQLQQLFGDDASARLLRDIHHKREGRMTETTENRPPTTEEGSATIAAGSQRPSGSRDASERTARSGTPGVRRRFRPGTVVAAFSLVIAAGIALAFLVGNSDSESAGPVDVARSFIEARDAWDAETTVGLFAPAATVSDLEVGSVGDYAAQYEWYRAVEWRWEAGECVETPRGLTSEVSCAYTHHNAWMDATGAEPGSGSFEFLISQSKITELSISFTTFPAWDQFRAWVDANHPEDLSVMYESGGGFQPPRYTPESMALWEQYTSEFVASVTSPTTP